MIVVEYDGVHHLDTPQRRTDLLRREELEREGWLFVVLVSDDVFVAPAATVERVRAALAERGPAPRRRRLSPEWGRSFPSRAAA
jgi:very-short-patch-repair endonuclease